VLLLAWFQNQQIKHLQTIKNIIHIYKDEYLTGLKHLKVTGYYNSEFITAAIFRPVKPLLRMKGSQYSKITLIQSVCLKRA